MKTFTQLHRTPLRRPTRAGVSLIEVLFSIAILSIGVIGVALLLPISILRTAQATQLTNAVFLRNNAEALIEANPSILTDTSLINPPAPVPGGSYNKNNGVARAVIDPLGNFIEGSSTFWKSTALSPTTNTYPYLPRLAAGATTINQAANLAQLPDSWTDVFDSAIPSSGLALTASPPTIAPQTTIPTFNFYNSTNINNPHYRLVLTDISGNLAVRPWLQQPTTTTLSWWDPSATIGPSLPTGFTPVHVKIQVMQRRFTWLATVSSRQVGPATWSYDVDLAVVFNRAFTSLDETYYTVVFAVPGVGTLPGTGAQLGPGFDGAPGVANVDDDGNGTVDDPAETNWRGSDDSRTVTVEYNPLNPAVPVLKKGGFMLEPNYLGWYRILDLKTRPQAPNSVYVDLLLDNDVKYDPTMTVPANGTVQLFGIFMKGVIDVYPLSTFSISQ